MRVNEEIQINTRKKEFLLIYYLFFIAKGGDCQAFICYEKFMDQKLRPDFDKHSLIAAVAQDAQTGEILMLAWMNEESYDKTLETGEAYYWSRSRQSLWHKGATSGATQIIKEIYLDCDFDAVILKIHQNGTGACHTGARSCFFNKILP